MPRISAAAKTVVRTNLLETAARHFSSKGLAATSVDAISFDAGYAKGTLYNYFRSKEALFDAVVEEAAHRAASRYRDARCSGSARKQLLALASADVAMMCDNQALTKVLVHEWMSFRVLTHAQLMQHYKPILDTITEIIDEGIATGQIRSDRTAADLAELFIGNLALLYVRYWGSDHTRPALDELPERAVDNFLHGAMGRETGNDDFDLSDRYQLNLFPRFFDDDFVRVETARRSAHDQNGQAAWQ